jgi:DNA-binding MurR/RpiR family transcriptional regulator
MSAARVAEIAGVSRSTVSCWVKTVDEHGFDALKTVIANDKNNSTITSTKNVIERLEHSTEKMLYQQLI